MRDGRAPFHPRSLAPAKLQRRVSPRGQNLPTAPHAPRRISPARRGTAPPSSANVQGSLSAPAIRLMLSRDHEFSSTRKQAIAVASPEGYSKKHNKRAAMIGCPQLFGGSREGYFGAWTTIRLAVMVK